MSNIKSISVDTDLINVKFNQLVTENESLKKEIVKLKIQNEYERNLRTEAEDKLRELENSNRKIRSSRKDIEDKMDDIIALREKKMSYEKIAKKLNLSPQTVSKELSYIEQTDKKINGVKKATEMNSVESYDDFKAIQQTLLNGNCRCNKNTRNYAFWTTGVALGLRVSDLVNLRYKHFLNDDYTFRKRIYTIEKKTQKAHTCLITEAVIISLSKYFDSIKWNFSMEDKVFNFGEGQAYNIITTAQKALNIPYNIGTHGMRKSFANIAVCVDHSSVDMNKITAAQGLLNHRDQRCTMRYLGTFQNMYDRMRESVSDFILGRTNINKLELNLDNDMERALELLEKIWSVIQTNIEI